jgi:hypothetical protein
VGPVLRQRAPVHVLELSSFQIVQMYVLSIIWNGEVRKLNVKGHAKINLYNIRITLLGWKVISKIDSSFSFLDEVPLIYLCFS